MRKRVALLLLVISQVHAQEGFPLDGTWRGELKTAGDAPLTIVLIMQWDGRKVTGLINPGPKAVRIDDAQLIPEGWGVSLTAHNSAGQVITFRGVLGELGKYDRTITGTWAEGGHSYQVRVVRE